MSNRTPYLSALLGVSILLIVALFGLTAGPQYVQASDGDRVEVWLPMIQLEEPLADASVGSLQGALHVVGGLSPAGPTNIHLQWEPRDGTWQSLPHIPVPRADAITYVVNDSLYVLGGYNMWYGGAISYTHSYSATTQQWITETAMLTPTSGATGALLNGAIYVFGGFDNISETSVVQSYNPSNRTWTVHNPMPVARSESASAVLNGLVYIMGGNIFSATMGTHVMTGTAKIPSTLVSVYDPMLDQWSVAAPLPEPRVDATALVRNGKIYLMGGTDQWLHGSVRSDLYIYDPDLDGWSVGPELPDASAGLRSTVIGNRIYAIGGYGDDGQPIPNVNILDRLAATIYLPTVNNR